MKAYSIITVICVIVLSCQIKKKNANEVSNQTLITDQSEISYSTCGEGDTALFFVHGWNINKSYWSGQQNRFCKDYQIVTMDLPGFGQSKNLKGEYSIDSYATDVKELINSLDLNKVILIGHSMGSRVVLEAAQGNDKVIALMAVDDYKDVSQILTDELKAEADGFVEWLQQDFTTNSALYASEYMIHPETDSLIKQRIISDYRRANPETSIPAIEAYFNYPYSEQERLSNLNIPLFLLSGDMMPVDTVGLQNTGLDYQNLVINKSGHFPMVEQLEIFNQKLAMVLKSLVKSN